MQIMITNGARPSANQRPPSKLMQSGQGMAWSVWSWCQGGKHGDSKFVPFVLGYTEGECFIFVLSTTCLYLWAMDKYDLDFPPLSGLILSFWWDIPLWNDLPSMLRAEAVPTWLSTPAQYHLCYETLPFACSDRWWYQSLPKGAYSAKTGVNCKQNVMVKRVQSPR